jgi:hypothetical protein
VHFLQNIRPSVTLELESGFKIRSSFLVGAGAPVCFPNQEIGKEVK